MKVKIVLILCFLSSETFADEYVPKYLQNKYNLNNNNYAQPPPAPSKTNQKTKTKTVLAPGTYKGGCVGQPTPPHNAEMRCSAYGGCRITCLPDHKFPDGSVNVMVECRDAVWMPLTESGTLQSCEPICLPECVNNGICVAPNECNCPDTFSGPQCQFENKPCLNFPPMPMNSRRSCRATLCTITCMDGHQFPDGTGLTMTECVDGQWRPTKPGWQTVPDCAATCAPPCRNGGNCLSFNVCQCPQDYRGPQCQYSASVCGAKKLQFNGAYNCSGDADAFHCSITCPAGIPFEFEPQAYYTCRYDTGRFLPEPIPQCVYPDNMQVISSGSTSHTYYRVSNYSVNSNSHSGQEVTDEDEDVIVYTGQTSYRKKKKPTSDNFINDTNIEVVPVGQYGVDESEYVTVEEKLPKPGTCFTWGGSHYKTFDGKIYSLNSKCSYVLAKDARDGTFTVIIGNNAECTGEDPSKCHRIVKIYLQDKEYILKKSDENFPILVSTKKIHPIPGQLPGLRAEMVAHFVVISLDPVGAKVKWDGQNLVQVEINEALWNRTEGMCGRMDGTSGNDLTTQQGKPAKNPLTFASSWKASSLEDECNEIPTEQHACSESAVKMKQAEEFCRKILYDKKFMDCQKVVKVNLLLDACKADYCSCTKPNPNECACDALNIYIRSCAYKGVKNLVSWRDEKLCPMTCSGGRIYMPCAPVGGQAICGASVESVSTACEEGCYCPSGTHLHKNTCITKDQCPCRLRGKDFAPGASVPKDCNTCTCSQGQWICTQVTCGARCSALGDPHYITFDGKRYDFMGQCTYYLVKHDNFSIEAENVACSGAISAEMNFPISIAAGLPSCTKTVTVRYGGLNIRLKQNHDLVINGKDVSTLPFYASGVKIRSVSSIFMVVTLPSGVQVWWDGLTRVYVDMPATLKGSTQGLCGTFNDNQRDDFLTPEKDVETSVTSFANKWKTAERCNDVADSLKSHPCTINVQNKAAAEKHCKVLRSTIFDACHWYVDPEPFYEDCLYDMCACNGKLANCLCPMIAAYAQECADKGVKIAWRADVHECGMVCPPGQTYQMCGNTCARSCHDLATQTDCRPQCAEGCNCPEGEALDDSGECVPIGQCRCHRDGLDFPAGFKEVRIANGRKELCTCINADWQCKPAKAQDQDQFPPVAHLQSKCNATRNLVFTTCETPEPITCKNMHDPDLVSAEICHAGCECKKGHVLDTRTKMCVPPSECPCHHGGRSYKENAVVQSDCNTCKCKNAKWECTQRQCSAECSAWGDSHFETFDGRLYDYQGQCDYVLAKGAITTDDAFDVVIQNVPCGTLGVACSKSVTIKVGAGGQQEAITLTRGKPVKDNQIFKRFTVRNKDLFTIIEAADLGLIIHWDKGTRVYVKVDPRWKSKVKGLCGNYNDNDADDFQTPSGGLSEVSPILFGDSWKLQSFCAETREVLDTCEQRPDRKVWAVSKCNVLKSAKFAPCHAIVPVEHYLERCVFDSCACDQGGDCECLCTAIAAYAQECSSQGAPVKWRSQELCPVQCDERCSEYSSCVSTCPVETCDNLLIQSPLSKLCKEDSCIEGCQPKPCPADHVYANESLLTCVPRNLCKPVCMEIDNVVYYEGDLMEEDRCHTCYCSRGKKSCKGQSCPTSMTTTETPSHEQDRQCKPGWSDWVNQDHAGQGKTGDNRYLENEMLPDEIVLNNMAGSSKCDKDQMIDIECRTCKTHLSPKETGMDVECSLEHGLICRSQKGHRPCPDFEIRVMCKCDPPVIPCDPRRPNEEYPGDCQKFYQCAPYKSGYGLVEKICGEGTLYNPQTMICDWPSNVISFKPECGVIPPLGIETTTGAGPDQEMCDAGQRYDSCGIECDKLCMHYAYTIKQVKGFCQHNTPCEADCVSAERMLTCPTNQLWANNHTCVSVHDCMCASHDGKPVKPGTIHKESDCMICQCVDNYYTCDKTACGEDEQKVVFATQMYENATRTVEIGQILVVFSTVTPPKDCPPEMYSDLIQGEKPLEDNAFSASSVLSANFAAHNARIDAKANANSGGSWSPKDSNKEQFLQINLGRQEPIYGVVIKGSPLYTEYVTSFKVMYAHSTDGIWHFVLNRAKEPQIFRGCMDGNMPVQHIFALPIEAQYVKILPQTWHGSIALRVELIGCGVGRSTTAEFITFAPPRPDWCLDPMGLSDGTMSDQQIAVSSELGPGNSKKELRLNASTGWRPITNSPSEFVQFDFMEPRNITGFVSKGGPSGWVTAFRIKYSHDGKTWMPIMDDGLMQEKTFLGNFDEGTAQMTNFLMPTLATYVKVIPLQWHKNIELRLEMNGCYLPYPTVMEPEVSKALPSPCNECPEVNGGQLEMGACRCEANTWWDGEKCVTRPECPCIQGHFVYPIGTVFEQEDCSQCVCKLGGVPHCTPKTCPPCAEGLRSTVTSTCSCVCLPCDEGTTLCPTSNICINSTSWCDGIRDCPDDEINCHTTSTQLPTTIYEELLGTTKISQQLVEKCPMLECPPDYKPIEKPVNSQQISYISTMFSTYSKKTPKTTTFDLDKPPNGGLKGGNRQQLQRPADIDHQGGGNGRKGREECPEFVCVSIKPTPPVKPNKPCPPARCPPGYDPEFLSEAETDKSKCPQYACVPTPLPESVCNITGKTFNTFDGTEFKYDVCNHILARDLQHAEWDILLQKNCTHSGCTRNLIIHHNDHTFILHHDMSVEFNGFKYSMAQTKKIGSNSQFFSISRLGNTLLFVSNHFGFWAIWDNQGNLKLGVASKLTGKVDGLCGFYNGRTDDDKRQPDGTEARTTAEFGDSWLQNEGKLQCDTAACPPDIQNKAWDMCNQIKSQVLSPCAKVMDLDAFVSRCLETTCSCLQRAKENGTLEDACRCKALETFVVDCMMLDNEIELVDWRTLHDCPVNCESPLVYQDCYRRRCEPSCESIADPNACPKLPSMCFPGCYCPPGLVRKGDACIKSSTCKDCECNVLPHLQYVTYDDANFTVSGNCVYVMSRDVLEKYHDEHQFQVLVTNHPCRDDASRMCVGKITILHHGHKIHVYYDTARNKLKLIVDAERVEDFAEIADWAHVRTTPSKHMKLLLFKIQVEVSVYFPSLGVSVKAPSHKYAGKLEGLCGDCDKDAGNDMRTPGGVIEPDVDELGPSWLYDKLPGMTNENCQNQPKEECHIPAAELDPCMQLLDSTRYAQCHPVLDPGMFLEWCHKDTACGERQSAERACAAIGSYARECLSNGFCVNWHSTLCPQRECPTGQHYETCGTSCPQTCDASSSTNCHEVPTSGCFCAPGTVLLNGTCVEARKCITCDQQGHHPGDHWTPDPCTQCECEGASIRCETLHCPAVDTVCESGYTAVKLAKEAEECCEKYVCVPAATAPSTCDPPQELQCAHGQSAKLVSTADGCQQFVCQCIPPEECEPINLDAEEGLDEGMEKRIKDGGCCKTVELVCNKSLCSAELKCEEFYTLNRTEKEDRCCPEYKCVPPENCIVDLGHIDADNGGERARSQYEKQKLLKRANETWNDGPCRACKCYGSKSTGFHTACTITECPLPTSSLDYADYDLLVVPTKGQCCPEVKRSGCKYNSKIYRIGEKWTDEYDPCTKLECAETKGYGVQKLTQLISCDETCDIGHEYVPSTQECCGSCKAIGCVHDGLVKPVDANWTSDDFCIHYSCQDQNGTMQVQSLNVVCGEIPDDHFQHFVYEFESVPGECCKKHKMIACKVGDTMYMPGQSFPCPDGDKCKTYTCVEDSPGILKKQESIKTCDRDCPLGWQYEESSRVCCGDCVQYACVESNVIKPAGSNWTSPDNCTTYLCDNYLGQYIVTSQQAACPQIDDCPADNVYEKGCCKYCNMTAMAMGDCVPMEMQPKKSVHMISADREGHGQCTNIEPLKGFTECVGTCHSSTLFNKESGKHESVCSCCRATQYTNILVELACQDGYKFQKPISVPAKCACEGCSQIANPLLENVHGVKGVKTTY